MLTEFRDQVMEKITILCLTLWIFNVRQVIAFILNPHCRSFSTSAMLIFWASWVFVVRGCLVYPGIFSSSLGLYPLYAKQLCQLKMFPDVVRCLLGEGKTRSTLFENHWFMGIWELPLKYFFIFSCILRHCILVQ